MVTKVVMVIGSLLPIGGVGYSEMPSGHFWVGVGEAVLGLIILKAAK